MALIARSKQDCLGITIWGFVSLKESKSIWLLGVNDEGLVLDYNLCDFNLFNCNYSNKTTLMMSSQIIMAYMVTHLILLIEFSVEMPVDERALVSKTFVLESFTSLITSRQATTTCEM